MLKQNNITVYNKPLFGSPIKSIVSKKKIRLIKEGFDLDLTCKQNNYFFLYPHHKIKFILIINKRHHKKNNCYGFPIRKF